MFVVLLFILAWRRQLSTEEVADVIAPWSYVTEISFSAEYYRDKILIVNTESLHVRTDVPISDRISCAGDNSTTRKVL